MPKRNAPEFSYNEKTGLYRKQIKNPCNGKWIPVYGKTKAELRQKVQAKTAELVAAQRDVDDPFVYQYAAEWYRLKTGSLGEKRKYDYKNAINNHICPVIGSMRVSEVTAEDVDCVMLKLAGKSKSLQQKVVTTLKRIFKYAVKNKLIAESPCDELVAEGKDAAEKIPLTRDQQKRLLDALKDTKAELIVALGLYAGLRREEVLSLQWDAVHLDTQPPYLSVIRAVRWDGKNTAIISDVLKSDASRRDIPIPRPLSDILQCEAARSTSVFVVSNRTGDALSATGFRKVWDAIRVRSERDVTLTINGEQVVQRLSIGDKIPKHNITISLDFHVTPHQLRHTYITELILSGANIKTVQYLAGHKNVKLTLDIYTHLIENQPIDTAPTVIKAFEAKPQVNEFDKLPQSVDKSGVFN